MQNIKDIIPTKLKITNDIQLKSVSTAACSCVSIAISVCVLVILSDKTTTDDTTITKLATGIVHHECLLTN